MLPTFTSSSIPDISSLSRFDFSDVISPTRSSLTNDPLDEFPSPVLARSCFTIWLLEGEIELFFLFLLYSPWTELVSFNTASMNFLSFLFAPVFFCNDLI